MVRVKAITQSTAVEFQALEKSALELARTTRYTARQVADGMGFMAMAGFKSNEIIASMPSVLRLATVGMMDLANAADITTNILTGYGLEIQQLEWANDILASAMTGANVDLMMLGESFKYVGPIAKGAGVEFETTAAAIALMGNAGIQGSQAGTSLRNAISRLLNPTRSARTLLKRLGIEAKDATTGGLIPFEDIVAQLEKSGASTADMLELFGQRAGPAMAALVEQGSDSLREFIARLRESGGLAERIEREQLNTLSGQWLILKSQIEGVAITIGKDLMPYARTLVWIVQDMVRWFENLDGSQRTQIAKWIALGAAVLGIVAVLGVTATAISAFIKGMILFGTVISLLASPLVLGITLIALAVGGLVTLWDKNWGDIQDKTETVTNAILAKWNELVVWWDNSTIKVRIEEFWSGLVETWTSKELSFRQKVSETINLTLNLIFGPNAARDINLYIGDLKTIWGNGVITLSEKVAQTIALTARLLFGEEADQKILDYWNNLKAVWGSQELSFGEKVAETIELTVGNTVITIGLATIAAILTWKIAPAIFVGLSKAVTNGIAALASGGLLLGKVAVAGIILALAAGAIGWAFGDKEGRAAFVDAIHESIKSMTLSDPVSIPIGIMDIMSFSFDFGAGGLKKLRSQVAELQEQVSNWKPGKTEAPEWLKDLTRGFVELGIAMSGFLTEGFLLAFDLGELLIRTIDKAILSIFQSFIDLGKTIGQAIVNGVVGILPDWFKDWLGIEGSPAMEIPKSMEQSEPQTPIGTQYLEELDAMWKMWELGQPSAPDTLRPITDHERQILATIAQLEAGVDGLEGMTAVIEVIFNRMDTNAARYGGTIEEVIRKSGQFEPVMTGAFDKLLDSGNVSAEALEAVNVALKNMAENTRLVGNAVYFANLDIVRARNPNGHWMLDSTRLRPVATIGGHTFGEPGENYSVGTPFTGWGALDEPAGIVHKREAVIPWKVLKRGGLAVLEFLGMPGFKDGRTVPVSNIGSAQNTVGNMSTMFNQLGKTILLGLNKLFDILVRAIEALALALVGDEKVAEIKAYFATIREGISELEKTIAEFTKKSSESTSAAEETANRWRDIRNVLFGTLGEGIISGIPELKSSFDTYKKVMRETGEINQETGEYVAGTGNAWMAALTAILNFAMGSETIQKGLQALAVPIAIVANVLGLVLMPVLEMLFPVFKLFGLAVLKVAEVLAHGWNAIAKAINWALGWLGVNLPTIDTDKIEENYRKLAGLEWDDLIKGANDTSEALRNVPSGLRIMANRMSAAGYQSIPIPEVAGVNAVGAQNSATVHEGDTYQITITGDVYGIDDLDRKIESAISKANRRNQLATYGV